jgi:hypothetical protein
MTLVWEWSPTTGSLYVPPTTSGTTTMYGLFGGDWEAVVNWSDGGYMVIDIIPDLSLIDCPTVVVQISDPTGAFGVVNFTPTIGCSGTLPYIENDVELMNATGGPAGTMRLTLGP